MVQSRFLRGITLLGPEVTLEVTDMDRATGSNERDIVTLRCMMGTNMTSGWTPTVSP